MRLALILVALVAIPATAQTPPLQYRIVCDGTDIVVQLKANEIGVYQLPNIPHDICGKDI